MVSAVNSVLAIGGVGGLAVGLAGREILENLFTGLIILSSSPFEVGDEVLFNPPTGNVGSTASGLQSVHAVSICLANAHRCFAVCQQCTPCLKQSICNLFAAPGRCSHLLHGTSCAEHHLNVFLCAVPAHAASCMLGCYRTLW